jgi:hypothetical protein
MFPIALFMDAETNVKDTFVALLYPTTQIIVGRHYADHKFMAVELHVFIQNSRVPSRELWQQAIEQLGFPTVLDASLDVRNGAGSSRTIFRGQSKSFEFYLEPTSDIVSTYPHVAVRVGGRDMCATFRWGADLMECGAALSAAAALAYIADGVYFYPDDDIVYDAAEAVTATEGDLKQI